MKLTKKIIVLLLATVMVLTLFSGFSAVQSSPESTSPSASAEPSEAPALDASAKPESVTVTDAAGREVTLKQPVESVLTVYGIKYVLALGLGDKLVNGSKRPFDLAICPDLANGVTFGSDQMNAESIASIDPDVFIHKAGASELMDALDELGINSIGIYMETPEEVVSTIELLGKALGADERAAELVKYYQNLMTVGSGLTANVAEGDKPTAILMGNTIGKVAHSAMLQSIMIESAGGINLAADVEGEGTWPVVGVEQIFEWDPEFIFIMNSTSRDYDVESIMADPAWADLTAVKNGNVFVVPSDTDSWEYPCMQSALGTIWMISKMYPELLSDADLVKYVDDFYDFVYGVHFTREELNY